jgi:Na+-driven multidrug efflux pump
MYLSLVCGLAIAILAFLLILPMGVRGAAISYAFGATAISLLGGTWIFIKKRDIFKQRDKISKETLEIELQK